MAGNVAVASEGVGVLGGDTTARTQSAVDGSLNENHLIAGDVTAQGHTL